jgi:hypothetical protein
MFSLRLDHSPQKLRVHTTIDRDAMAKLRVLGHFLIGIAAVNVLSTNVAHPHRIVVRRYERLPKFGTLNFEPPTAILDITVRIHHPTAPMETIDRTARGVLAPTYTN